MSTDYKNNEGPWNMEPSVYVFTEEETGYQCAILRQMSLGHLCGYVRIPEGSILHGKDVDDDLLDDVYVHGGITFSENVDWISDNRVTGFYIGFDCSHSGDLRPFYGYSCKEDTYKTIGYVKEECIKLAKQLFKLNNIICDITSDDTFNWSFKNKNIFQSGPEYILEEKHVTKKEFDYKIHEITEALARMLYDLRALSYKTGMSEPLMNHICYAEKHIDRIKKWKK